MRPENFRYLALVIRSLATTLVTLFLAISFFTAKPGSDVYTYLTDFWRHSVLIIQNFQIIDNIQLSGGSTGSIDITPDLTRVYTTANVGNSISCLVVDPSSPQYRKEIAVIRLQMTPLSIKVHPEGLKAYAVAGRALLVIDIDPESDTYNTVIKQLTLPRYAFDLDITPGGEKVFIAYQENGPGTLAVVNCSDDELIDTDGIQSNGVTSLNIGQFVASSAWFKALKIGPIGYGFILNVGKYDGSSGDKDTISVFDAVTYEPIDVDSDANTTTPGEPDGISLIELPSITPTSLAFSPDGTSLYVSLRVTTNEMTGPNGKLLLIDADPGSPTFGRVLKNVEAGFRPEAVGVWPDGRYILVSCRKDRVVRVFDRNLRVVTSIPANYPGAMVSVERPRSLRRKDLH
jgi:DNA-binding beta-propeller fold protein YncE